WGYVRPDATLFGASAPDALVVFSLGDGTYTAGSYAGTEAEALARAEAEAARQGVTLRGRAEAPLLSEDADQTETPEFRRWFGDSKVVDADGKPLVVYHGTGRSFDAFDPSQRGAVTRASSARKLFFFTDSAEV